MKKQRVIRDVVCSKCGFPIRDGICDFNCDGKADGEAVSILVEDDCPCANCRLWREQRGRECPYCKVELHRTNQAPFVPMGPVGRPKDIVFVPAWECRKCRLLFEEEE